MTIALLIIALVMAGCSFAMNIALRRDLEAMQKDLDEMLQQVRASEK
jgi:low affinity Fe/Cu permease